MHEPTGTRVMTLACGGSVVVVRDYTAMSLVAAEIVASIVADHPGTALTLPTGETPRLSSLDTRLHARIGTGGAIRDLFSRGQGSIV